MQGRTSAQIEPLKALGAKIDSAKPVDPREVKNPDFLEKSGFCERSSNWSFAFDVGDF